MDPATTLSIDPQRSFIQFIYPFQFEPDAFDAIQRAVDDVAWSGQGMPQGVWEYENANKWAELVPELARYINPPRGAGEEPPATAWLWSLAGGPRQSPAGLGGDDAIQWFLRIKSDQRLAFTLSNVRLMLFRFGAGFLIFEVQLETPDSNEWLTFLHHFRFLSRRAKRIEAVRQVHPSPAQPEDYFPVWLGGTAVKAADRKFGRFVDGLLRMISVPNMPGDWWRDAFVPDQLLAFAALFGTRSAATPDTSGEALLFRLRNFFHPGQGVNPHPSELSLARPDILPYAQDHYFTFSPAGVAFFGCDSPSTPFFQTDLPSHLRDQYALLCLLVLLQRFALLRLSYDVSEKWLHRSVRDRIDAFSVMNDRFFEFTARGHFVVAAQQSHHQQFYQRWAELLGIEKLYDEVESEIRSMAAYCERQFEQEVQRSERSLATLLGIIGLFLGIPSLILSVLDLPLQEWGGQGVWTLPAVLQWAFGMGWAIAAVIFLAWWGFWRMARAHRAGKIPKAKS